MNKKPKTTKELKAAYAQALAAHSKAVENKKLQPLRKAIVVAADEFDRAREAKQRAWDAFNKIMRPFERKVSETRRALERAGVST